MGTKTYIVKAGDTLSIIADRELKDIDLWPDIAYMNSLTAPYIITPGQKLFISDGKPMQITVAGGTGKEQAVPVQKAALVFNPATIALFVGGAALIYFWDEL